MTKKRIKISEKNDEIFLIFIASFIIIISGCGNVYTYNYGSIKMGEKTKQLRI